jgi:hypothetical protein
MGCIHNWNNLSLEKFSKRFSETFTFFFSSLRAPADCTQYFTGQSGTFRSFNWQTTTPQTLQSQNYNICFRQEEGYNK